MFDFGKETDEIKVKYEAQKVEYKQHLCNCKMEKETLNDRIANLLAENERLKKELEAERSKIKTAPAPAPVQSEHELIQEIRFKDIIV